MHFFLRHDEKRLPIVELLASRWSAFRVFVEVHEDVIGTIQYGPDVLDGTDAWRRVVERSFTNSSSFHGSAGDHPHRAEHHHRESRGMSACADSLREAGAMRQLTDVCPVMRGLNALPDQAAN